MLARNEFCNIIVHIGLLKEQADRLNYVLSDPLYQMVENDFISPYIFTNPVIEQDLVDVLENMYEDKDGWISYYLYELDCGADWEPGMITSEDGKDIRLTCANDLYNLLMENLKNDNI